MLRKAQTLHRIKSTLSEATIPSSHSISTAACLYTWLKNLGAFSFLTHWAILTFSSTIASLLNSSSSLSALEVSTLGWVELGHDELQHTIHLNAANFKNSRQLESEKITNLRVLHSQLRHSLELSDTSLIFVVYYRSELFKSR